MLLVRKELQIVKVREKIGFRGSEGNVTAKRDSRRQKISINVAFKF